MTKTLDELMAKVDFYAEGCASDLRNAVSGHDRLVVEDALRELIAERDTLKDALWKSCGDDEQMVNDYIESQRPTHQG